MKHLALSLIAGTASIVAMAQAQPDVHAGDQWTYEATIERAPAVWNKSTIDVTATRVTPTSIYVDIKQSGSTQPPRSLVVGADWSRSRDVNGKQTVVNRPFAFPLDAGKSWKVDYSEDHPNRAHRLEQWDQKFQVVGYEAIDVPAGHFNALKIESEGRWNAELEPAAAVAQNAVVTQNNTTMITQSQRVAARPVSGRAYKAYWYVPEIKRWVKSVEEVYSSADVRTERTTEELVAFKPAAAP